jgi:two-component system, NtrC family, nitrogen regulation response regulator NtrX
MRQILIVDDEKNIRGQLAGLLTDEGYRALAAPDAEKGLALLEDETVDLVLLDVMLPGLDGLAALERIRADGRDVPVIVMSGQATLDAAVRATKLGAYDYLEKPLDPDKLLITLRNALQAGRLTHANRELRAQIRESGGGLVGTSAAMERLRSEIGRAAAAGARVLITGENGTGKELVARALHDGSPRAGAVFVKVNCAAIPKDLIESELFGHEKGAFTGAVTRRIGKLEAADGGSLLLDEVGDMALDAQAKLLRVLEENEVERVGGKGSVPVDVRVIAATNKNLPKAIEGGEFREDLFYRLNVVPIAVPPLRERAEDIPLLVEHFRERLRRETGRAPRPFDDAAIRELCAWSWPGNVRELRNAVERLEIMAPGNSVGADDVRSVLAGARGAGGGTATVGTGGGNGAPALAAVDGELPLRELLEATERGAIERALDAAGGVISEAARRLGMDRANLHRKMRRLGIGRDDDEDVSE